MLLIRRSPRANNAVRTASVGGELLVASLVIGMLLVSFGDALDPALFGEAGLEFAIFDLGGEFSVLAMRHWHLLELLLAGGIFAAGLCILRVGAPLVLKTLRAAPRRAIDKVPIRF
ncbi:hypothetical protein BH11PSE3_BH11PSE3_02660 [soil metagenome]